MSGARLNDLIYGHSGDAVYDSENHQWIFTRIPGIQRRIKPLGQSSIVISPSIKAEVLTGLRQPAHERSRSVRDLIHCHPEVAPTRSLLSHLAKESSNIEAFTDHGSGTATLLAYGKARDETLGSSRVREIPILAVAGGSDREALRLLPLKKKQIRWEDDRAVGLFDFTPNLEEETWWAGNGSPVLQVCFGEAESRCKTWLAVRCHVLTTILQPVLRPHKFQADLLESHSSTKTQTHSSSWLDANPISDLSIENTGGCPHVDVTFNHWNALQFAILDQQGQWTLWDLECQKKKRGIWKTTIKHRGYVGRSHPEEVDFTVPEKDAWGSILWAGDANTIVVATRKNLSVFRIDKSIERISSPNIPLPGSKDLILEVKTSPRDNSHLFLATSTRVFWLRVTPGKEGNEEAALPGVSILLSWRHYYSQDDVSLRMDVLYDEETTAMLLYSRLTSICIVYSFKVSDSPLNLPQSVSDPFLLPLLHQNDNKKITLSRQSPNLGNVVSCLSLQRVGYDVLNASNSTGIGALYRERGVKFYQLYTLYGDLSLSQCLYVEQTPGDQMQVQTPKITKDTDILKRTVKKSELSFIAPNRSIVHNAVHLDGDLDLEERVDGNKDRTSEFPDEDPWTLNFRWLDREIQRSLSVSSPNSYAVGPGITFEQSIRLLHSAMKKKMTTEDTTIESLLDMLDSDVYAADVDNASRKLQEFVESVEKTPVEDPSGRYEPRIMALTAHHILPSLFSYLSRNEKITFAHIYDRLVHLWIAPLSRNLSTHTRVAIEKEVRVIAIRLSLASFGVHLSSRIMQVKEEDHDTPRLSGQDVFNLPVRGKSSSQNLWVNNSERLPDQSLSQLGSSQISADTGFMHWAAPKPLLTALPTPEKTPSLHSPIPVSCTIGAEDPASQRLRALVSLAPQPTLPASASNFLRHWSIGADPATYDWEATQQAIHAEQAVDSTDDDDSTDDENAHLRKRAVKRVKLGRKEHPPPPSSSHAAPVKAERGHFVVVPDDYMPDDNPVDLVRRSQMTAQDQRTPSGLGKGKSKTQNKKRVKKPGF